MVMDGIGQTSFVSKWDWSFLQACVCLVKSLQECTSLVGIDWGAGGIRVSLRTGFATSPLGVGLGGTTGPQGSM